jgi:hypothetical protein
MTFFDFLESYWLKKFNQTYLSQAFANIHAFFLRMSTMKLVVSILSNLLNKDNYIKKIAFFVIFESAHEQ